MGNLYLVRHAQASFGAADYDNLNELGHRQSVRLGEYFAKNGVQFDAVLTGTLKRHAQTYAGICQASGHTVAPLLHGVTSALEHIRKNHTGNVLIVSSGGPIATALGHILGTAPETTVKLNMRIRNSSVTECTFNTKHHQLLTFNTLPHLDGAEYAPWITYA